MRHVYLQNPVAIYHYPALKAYELTVHPGNEGEHSEGMKPEQLIEP